MSEIIICTSCGASNELPHGKNSMFCSFCGSSIQNNRRTGDKIKSKLPKSELVKAVIAGTIRGKKLAYLNRNIESIDEIAELYSDSELEEIKNLDLSNNLINSLDGIERFELNMLSLANNKIKIIDKLPKFDGRLIVSSYPMHVELDFSNNQELTDISDEVISQIENPGFSDIGYFLLNFNGCPKLNLDNFAEINFSIYSSPDERAVFEIVIDSEIEFPEKLKEKGFVKSTNVFSMNFVNAWEYSKKKNNAPANINPQKGSCFIATATMGSYNHPEVKELRNFRDNWILEKRWGQRFVDWYYHYGAIAGKSIEKSFLLKKISYLFIVKPLYIISKLITKK